MDDAARRELSLKFHRANSLDELNLLAEEVARDVVAPHKAIRSAFIVAPRARTDATWGWVLETTTLRDRRFYRSLRLSEQLSERRLKHGPCVLPIPPAQLIETADASTSALLCAARATLIVPLVLTSPTPSAPEPTVPSRETGFEGAWWILAIDEAFDPLGETYADELDWLSECLGHTLKHVFISEQTEVMMQQSAMIHRTMEQALGASDRLTLMAACLQILGHQFGFSRILVALPFPETKVLNVEVHTGFPPSFDPAVILRESDTNPVFRVLESGRLQLMETGRGEIPNGFPQYETIRRDDDAPVTPLVSPERALVLPLRFGRNDVGLVYADQILHDGSPMFSSVLHTFGALMASALEGFNQRDSAERRAETDGLTGLYNRFFLDKTLKIEIPRIKRYNDPISLLMIDLLGFKEINDTYGHPFGDYLLREAANLIRNNVRDPDIVVRYGGDEFVVLMAHTNHEQAQQVRNRIEQAFIERNLLQTSVGARIDISMGLRSADAETIGDDLVEQADKAMYENKARQRRRRLIEAILTGPPKRIEQADKVAGSLCNMMGKKVPWYTTHAQGTAHLALRLAERVRPSMALKEKTILVLAALLHDVGEVSIPTDLLQKTEPLSDGERAALQHHPIIGEEFFEGIPYLEPIRPIIRAHHERYDGDTEAERFPSYPDGLTSRQIPFGARVLRLAESAECLLRGRPYREALTRDRILDEIKNESGGAYDPGLVVALEADETWTDDLDDKGAIMRLLDTSETQTHEIKEPH